MFVSKPTLAPELHFTSAADLLGLGDTAYPFILSPLLWCSGTVTSVLFSIHPRASIERIVRVTSKLFCHTIRIKV